MRKNGSRLISIQQYRATDLFIFALILLAAELLSFFATKWFPADATFSMMVPIVLTVMVRWGWPSVLYAAAAGAVGCLLSFDSATGYQYLSYILGNAFIAIMLLPLKFFGKDSIRSRWYFSALFAIGGWTSVYLGRSLCWLISVSVAPADGMSIWSGFISFALGDLLSLVMAVVVVLVVRMFDGMFEDQISYLKRVDREKRDRLRFDQFGEGLQEIDEETFKKLYRDNDIY